MYLLPDSLRMKARFQLHIPLKFVEILLSAWQGLLLRFYIYPPNVTNLQAAWADSLYLSSDLIVQSMLLFIGHFRCRLDLLNLAVPIMSKCRIKLVNVCNSSFYDVFLSQTCRKLFLFLSLSLLGDLFDYTPQTNV
eukprot:c10126_g2_i1 orf=41-448(-)